jgi:hypothetical protein
MKIAPKDSSKKINIVLNNRFSKKVEEKKGAFYPKNNILDVLE